MNTASRFSKLAIGTAQFGLPYGIANQNGQVSPVEAAAILNESRRAGIRTLDTAVAYGNSESVLGQVSLDGFSVITKLPAAPPGCENVSSWIDSQLKGSLSRLNLTRIDSLLLHRPDQLLGDLGAEIFAALDLQRQKGLIGRIGVSVYSPDELGPLLKRYKIDLVQAPFNVFDTRLLDSGWLTRLADSNIKLHVRSIFLQGLLLMAPSSRPDKFKRWAAHWELWDQWLSHTGLTPLQACLRFALNVPQIEQVVVGVDHQSQLIEIIEAAKGACPNPPLALRCADVDLLEPSRWSTL